MNILVASEILYYSLLIFFMWEMGEGTGSPPPRSFNIYKLTQQIKLTWRKHTGLRMHAFENEKKTFVLQQHIW